MTDHPAHTQFQMTGYRFRAISEGQPPLGRSVRDSVPIWRLDRKFGGCMVKSLEGQMSYFQRSKTFNPTGRPCSHSGFCAGSARYSKIVPDSTGKFRRQRGQDAHETTRSGRGPMASQDRWQHVTSQTHAPVGPCPGWDVDSATS